MDDFVNCGAEDEPAPLAAASGDLLAHAKKTHDEKQKGC